MFAAQGSSAARLAYLFEAKGIQKWILEGGRLRHIAAASNILAACCQSTGQDLLATVMHAAAFPATASRRAGGAFMLHFPVADTAAFDRFRALWRLVFCQIAPGLEFVESIGRGATDTEARTRAYDPARQIRPHGGRENTVASLLPLGHPLTQFAPRTGRPAVAGDRDQVTESKRLQYNTGDAVGDKFLPRGAGAEPMCRWPNQMDDEADTDDTASGGVYFPFPRDDRWVAVMHADISALGAFYAAVGDAAAGTKNQIEVAFAAARAIEEAVIAAAQAATRQVLFPGAAPAALPVMPARPILLGGDDITIILRGDVALPFARVFLEQLETQSEQHLARFSTAYLSGEGSVRGPLTAAAGLAFGKAKQPFFRLLELAESLCGQAKGEAKKAAGGGRPASVVSFLRVTESALAADASEMFDRLIVSKQRRLTAQPYRVGSIPAAGFADLADLDRLRGALTPRLRAGRLREIRALWLQGLDDMAEEDWQRWQKMARRRHPDGLRQFSAQLASMLGEPPSADTAIFAKDSAGGVLANATPLFDAMEWNAISSVMEDAA